VNRARAPVLNAVMCLKNCKHVYVIQNTDQLCLARACVMGRHRADRQFAELQGHVAMARWTLVWEKMRRRNRPTQVTAARELMSLVPELSAEDCSLTLYCLKLMQDALGRDRYRLMVFGIYGDQLFDSYSNGSRRVALLYMDNHFHILKNVEAHQRWVASVSGAKKGGKKEKKGNRSCAAISIRDREGGGHGGWYAGR
jgi:hypothetical protein